MPTARSSSRPGGEGRSPRRPAATRTRSRDCLLEGVSRWLTGNVGSRIPTPPFGPGRRSGRRRPRRRNCRGGAGRHAVGSRPAATALGGRGRRKDAQGPRPPPPRASAEDARDARRLRRPGGRRAAPTGEAGSAVAPAGPSPAARRTRLDGRRGRVRRGELCRRRARPPGSPLRRPGEDARGGCPPHRGGRNRPRGGPGPEPRHVPRARRRVGLDARPRLPRPLGEGVQARALARRDPRGEAERPPRSRGAPHGPEATSGPCPLPRPACESRPG
jgi:hypothetical protein